jgi:hypothetical protein
MINYSIFALILMGFGHSKNNKWKYIITILEYSVGILFIISGLIKLNDPIGFHTKLAEYFSEPVFNIVSRACCCLVISAFFGYCWSSLGNVALGYKAQFTIWVCC